MIDDKNIVHGIAVDIRTGCEHYRSNLDIIAIKFKCCQLYYSCYFCHESLADHPVEIWQACEVGKTAVLCGNCKRQFTIQEYLQANNNCQHCGAQFNLGCKTHYHLYFSISKNNY